MSDFMRAFNRLRPETEQEASIKAAAPEMLEALKEIADWHIESHEDAIEMKSLAQTLIQKVEENNGKL